MHVLEHKVAFKNGSGAYKTVAVAPPVVFHAAKEKDGKSCSRRATEPEWDTRIYTGGKSASYCVVDRVAPCCRFSAHTTQAVKNIWAAQTTTRVSTILQVMLSVPPSTWRAAHVAHSQCSLEDRREKTTSLSLFGLSYTQNIQSPHPSAASCATSPSDRNQ